MDSVMLEFKIKSPLWMVVITLKIYFIVYECSAWFFLLVYIAIFLETS